MAIVMVPTIWNRDVFVQISNDFWQMVTICPDFKWLGSQISDPIRNPGHWQPNLFWTFGNPDLVGMQISLYLFSNKLSNLQLQIEQMSSPPILLQVLALSVKASNRAAELVRDVFQNKDLKIIQKTGEKDLQTKADRLANACIVGSLKKVLIFTLSIFQIHNQINPGGIKFTST